MDGMWASLEAEMAAAAFETDHMIDQQKLADAVNERLATPILNPVDPDGAPNPAGTVAGALVELEFVARGL